MQVYIYLGELIFVSLLHDLLPSVHFHYIITILSHISNNIKLFYDVHINFGKLKLKPLAGTLNTGSGDPTARAEDSES